MSTKQATLPVSTNRHFFAIDLTCNVISDLEVKFYDHIGKFMDGATYWRLNFEERSRSFRDSRGRANRPFPQQVVSLGKPQRGAG